MMLERWRQHDGKEIEVFQEFKILTSEIISRTAFGSNYLEGQSIFDRLTKFTDIIARNNYKISIPGIGKFVKMGDDIESDELRQEIRDCLINMIKNREKAAMEGKWSDFGSDFLGSLLSAHHETDEAKRLSVEDMIDECKTFYAAGHDTTRVSLTWTVFLLAIHTDWQDKARREVLEIFCQKNPSPEGITKLKTVSMIVNEALRLYPPAVMIPRTAHKEARLGQLILPENIEIIIPLLVLHNNPEIWGEDAHKQLHDCIFSISLGTSELCLLELLNYQNKDCSLDDSSELQVHFAPNLCPLSSSAYYTVPATWIPNHA